MGFLYKMSNWFPQCGDSVGKKCGRVIIVYEKCPLLCALIKVSGSSLSSSSPFKYFPIYLPSSSNDFPFHLLLSFQIPTNLLPSYRVQVP